MSNEDRAAEPLAQAIRRLRAGTPARLEEIYDRMADRLNGLDMAGRTLKPGDPMVPFMLPTTAGRFVSLGELVADGPVVLSFVRGHWCPYCRAEMTAQREAEAAIRAAGGRLAVITPEDGGRPGAMHKALGLGFDVLVDLDNGLALALGLVFPVPGELRDVYLRSGHDLAAHYGNDSWFLPVPATFVVDQRGIVRFAYADPDFRNRADPAQLIAAVRELAR